MKKLYTRLQPQIPLHVSSKLRIATQPRFRKKSFYVKLTTFFTAQKTQFDTKLMSYSESKCKIKVRPRCKFSKFYLYQQLFTCKEFRMETRLLNVSKTTNAKNFIKTILESSYLVLLVTCNLVAPRQPALFLTAVEF